MIPYILIIIGAIFVILGVIGLIRIALLPLARAHSVVFERKDDYLFYENKKGQRLLSSQKKFLLNIYISAIIIGILMFFAGFYIGFTDHGENFWLYKTLFGSEESQRSDRITEDGKFIAADGKEYNYYIMIKGAEIYFREDLCDDYESFEKRINGFDRTNTIVVYDDFAVASSYHSVINLLDKSGIHYIEEGN